MWQAVETEDGFFESERATRIAAEEWDDAPLPLDWHKRLSVDDEEVVAFGKLLEEIGLDIPSLEMFSEEGELSGLSISKKEAVRELLPGTIDLVYEFAFV